MKPFYTIGILLLLAGLATTVQLPVFGLKKVWLPLLGSLYSYGAWEFLSARKDQLVK